ncbi:MAG: hypothetical protein IJ770_03805 [Alphaproteobacteria bacterium]|nr:hypothetical protein [Alphaproteobacteria bacterium]
MQKIQTKDGKNYQVPVYVVISDCDYATLLMAFRDAVQKFYGNGWMCHYTECFKATDENPQFLLQKVGRWDPVAFAIGVDYKSEPYVCPFPWLIFVDYRGTEAITTMPDRTMREKIYLRKIIDTFNETQKDFVDRVYVNATSRFTGAYDVMNVPEDLVREKTVIFRSARELYETLLADDIFRGVKEI